MPDWVYLMNAACWGRMKMKRQTPTSCSEASSTYLWSREMLFCSSAAHSFWLVVLYRKRIICSNICSKMSAYLTFTLEILLDLYTMVKTVVISQIRFSKTDVSALQEYLMWSNPRIANMKYNNFIKMHRAQSRKQQFSNYWLNYFKVEYLFKLVSCQRCWWNE